MSPFRAQVKNGRLILDEPTDLPEGTVLDLVVDDEGVDLDAEERAALDDALLRSIEQARQDRTHPAADVLSELRKRR